MDLNRQELKMHFKGFWERHEENNRFLWNFRTSSLFVRGYIEGQGISLDTPLREFVRSELKGKWRKNINLKHYRGPYIEGSDDRPELLLEQYIRDSERSGNLVYQSIIVNEIRGLEILINDIYSSIASYVIASQSADNKTKEKMRKILSRVESDERHSVALMQMADLLPTLGHLLKGSTYKREENPFLSTKINGISCLDAVQMWKETRNLIIHRDGKISDAFSKRWSKTLISLLRDESNHNQTFRPGSQLLVSLRHTTYCLTTCHQTAVVLYVASGANIA